MRNSGKNMISWQFKNINLKYHFGAFFKKKCTKSLTVSIISANSSAQLLPSAI